jgi:hypothetical protein
MDNEPTRRQRERQQEQELLLVEDAQVRRVVAIRREMIADIRAVETRLSRLSFDLRRLDPLHLHPSQASLPRRQQQGRGREREQSSNGLLLISRALAIVDEWRGWFINLGLDGGREWEEQVKGKKVTMGIRGAGMEIGMIDKEDLLRVFTETLDFVDEARGALSFCERCVAKWNFNPRRGAECAAEICRALYEHFPGVNSNLNSLHTDTTGLGEGKGKDADSSNRGHDSGERERGSYGMKEEDMFQRLIQEVEIVPFRIQEPLRWRNYSTYY